MTFHEFKESHMKSNLSLISKDGKLQQCLTSLNESVWTVKENVCSAHLHTLDNCLLMATVYEANWKDSLYLTMHCTDAYIEKNGSGATGWVFLSCTSVKRLNKNLAISGNIEIISSFISAGKFPKEVSKGSEQQQPGYLNSVLMLRTPDASQSVLIFKKVANT